MKKRLLLSLVVLMGLTSVMAADTYHGGNATISNIQSATSNPALASVPQNYDIIDIDFSNPFVTNESDGSIYIAGTKGKMVFSNVEFDPSAESTAFMLGYQPEGGEVAYGDVLRVGNGYGVVMLASSTTNEETQATEWKYLYPKNAVLTIQFDVWLGNLNSKSFYVDLENAAGQRIAGFSINRYKGSLAYNDFGDGFDILKYATGVGSSSASNAAICADNNRTSFTLVVNYEKGTMQGMMSNPQKGTCTGAEISIPEMDDARVAKFVVGSNYNNKDRRCWFDNLLIRNYNSAEPIIFADPQVKSICVAHWDTNEDDELDQKEAAAVTNLGRIFHNRDITSFDELQYFTGLTSIGNSDFEGCSGLTSISIPNSVTTIGVYAFSGCSGLSSIEIPNSVTSIGNRAFYNCSCLTSITIPNSVTSIGESAFEGCSNLTSITIPESVTSIGMSAFEGTAWYNNLPDGLIYIGKMAYKYKGTMPENTSIAIEQGIVSISESAFLGCSGLTSITIPNSVTSIGAHAFGGCSLTSITIPNSVTSIGADAFMGCAGLTTIIIPESVTGIGDGAFGFCYNLTSIKVDSENSVYDSRDNCNAIINKTTNTLIAGCQNTVIPNSVTSIGNRAFYGCIDLTSITIPESVTSIGGATFADCFSLTSITIPESVTNIGRAAFDGCSNLTSITIPESVANIGKEAFRQCSSLTSVTIPESVTSIGWGTFMDCFRLTSIIIPKSVTSIDGWAFVGCTSLTSVVVNNSLPFVIEASTFNTQNNATLYVPKDSKVAYASADYWKDFKAIKEFPDPDVNQDGYVDVVDVVDVARFVVGTPSESFEQFLADLNGSGEVNVADAVVLVNEIAGDVDWSRPMHAPAISDGILTLTKNTDQSLSFSLKDDSAYTAFQFDLTIPEGMDVTQMTLNSSRKQNHQLLYNKISDGHYRVVALSTSNQSFNGTAGELLSMALDSQPADDTMIDNIHFVTTQGKDLLFGAIGISGDTPTGISDASRLNDNGERRNGNIVYNLNGQRLTKAQKGLYIIHGKKVVVK